MRRLLLGVVVFCMTDTWRPVSAAPAAPLNRPLKASQVACAARQLARVQRRMAAYGSVINYTVTGGDTSLDARGSILALSHTTLGGGIFSGLVRLPDIGAGGQPCNDFLNGREHFTEADLAFELIFKQRTDLLDPSQPRVPQATLVRRDRGTNFGVDHASCYSYGPILLDFTCPTILSLDLAAQAQDQLRPQAPIYLNSASAAAPGRTGPGAQPLAASTGRGPGILYDDLSQACGGTLTDFDQRVFEILARSILPSFYYLKQGLPICNDTFIDGYTMSIFRGTDPHIYRVDIYSYTSICCDDSGVNLFDNRLRVALEFKMSWNSEGRLTTGTVRVLPPCRNGQDLDCTPAGGTMALFVVPPIFPGHGEEPPSAFHNAPYLTIRGFDPSLNILSATINWADILKNTALNSP